LPEQMCLPSLRAGFLPVVARRNYVRRASLRSLAIYAQTSSDVIHHGFQARALMADCELLKELRLRARVASRSRGFVGSVAAHRLYRMIDELSARIEAQEVSLCG